LWFGDGLPRHVRVGDSFHNPPLDPETWLKTASPKAAMPPGTPAASVEIALSSTDHRHRRHDAD
jgi:hypothetical protein